VAKKEHQEFASNWLASGNAHPWDVSGTKPENAISRFLHFQWLTPEKRRISISAVAEFETQS
jgi:hypothetical protein